MNRQSRLSRPRPCTDQESCRPGGAVRCQTPVTRPGPRAACSAYTGQFRREETETARKVSVDDWFPSGADVSHGWARQSEAQQQTDPAPGPGPRDQEASDWCDLSPSPWLPHPAPRASGRVQEERPGEDQGQDGQWQLPAPQVPRPSSRQDKADVQGGYHQAQHWVHPEATGHGESRPGRQKQLCSRIQWSSLWSPPHYASKPLCSVLLSRLSRTRDFSEPQPHSSDSDQLPGACVSLFLRLLLVQLIKQLLTAFCLFLLLTSDPATPGIQCWQSPWQYWWWHSWCYCWVARLLKCKEKRR